MKFTRNPFQLILVLILIAANGQPHRLQAGEPARKPNLVIILADDLGWNELGCYGQQKIKTPNLDRMAAEGQRWGQFYSGAPVCSPSRNVLLTGRHTGGCNVQNLKRADPTETLDDLRGDWPMDARQYTLPAALKKAGYTTGAFGKWGMGEYGTTGAPDKHGVDYFYGYTDHRMCHTFYPPFLWRNGVKETINTPGIPGHAKQSSGEVKAETYAGQTHASKAILNELLGYLDRQTGTGQPFFIYYCPTEPHVAMQPPQEWVEKYPRDWDSEPYRGEKSYLPHPRPRAAYAATISFLDDHVGKVLAKLKEKGLDEQTLIIFTSDNGTTHDVGGVDHGFFNSVADLKGLKGSLYEGGIRVPTLIRWPGRVKAGQVVSQAGYSADLMPTLCALTGADAGQPYGENLLPIVLGQKKSLPMRKPLVWTGGGYGGQVAVRLGDMKAIRRELLSTRAGTPLNWEVYDLARDRGETNDLAATQREVIRQAEEVLRREYQTAEGYPVPRIFEPEKPAAGTAAANPNTPQSIFERLDTNRDGKLNFTEWQTSPRAKANPGKHPEIFTSLDTNSDKSISQEEFAAQFKKR
jgi:arylsulfatase A-like enzyme